MTNIRPKKSFGQNFLTDANVLARILETAQLCPDERVLEVGPGRGALTRLLTEHAAQVVAIELDRQLMPQLRNEFAKSHNVEIVQADILRIDLNELLPGRWQGSWKVVANLPYNISSQVLFKFLDCRKLFSRLVLMLQREVGERLVASPGSKEYGILSVFCQLHFDVRREFIVKPGSFYPVPKVDSMVLSFIPLPKARVEVGDEAFFRRVVKASFSQRRKTLWNCLKSADLGMSGPELTQALIDAGIDGKRRGETLSLKEFALLANVLVMNATKETL